MNKQTFKSLFIIKKLPVALNFFGYNVIKISE